MYGRDNERKKKEPWLIRFMVDQRFQGKGIGRKAMALILDQMKQKYPSEAIFLSTGPENTKVIAFYETFGFTYTGTIQHGEAVYALQAN